MPILRPIRPLRYGFDRIDVLGDLISPALSGEPEDRLQVGDVHPVNVRRLVRGVHAPDESPDEPEFVHAARLQRQWKERGVLVREPRPAYYAYEQRMGDASYKGAVCLVRLAPFDRTEVRPHEATNPTGAEDQLTRQLGALETQLSMVMGFVPDRSGALAEFLDRDDRPWLTVPDGRGIMNRLWREQDPGVHVRLAEALRDETAVIADGHHRYAAALRHQATRSATGPVTRERPYDYVMMLLRPTTGGTAGAWTHRVFQKLGTKGQQAMEAAMSAFEVLADGTSPDLLDRLDESPGTFAVVTPGRVRIVRARDEALSSPAIQALPPVLQDVDAVVLATLLLDPISSNAAWDSAADSRSGQPFSPNQVSARDAGRRTFEGEASAAFLLCTATPEVVQRVAAAGEVMPPRSTKFRPKPVKGLLMNSLVSF